MDIDKMKSELKMNNLFFPQCTIERKAVVESGEMNLNLKKEIKEIENGCFVVTLTLSISKDQELNVKVVAEATFSMDNEDKEFVRNIMNNNTVAIMFPFIRSQVSLLTTQPGMAPIIVPPINIEKFVEE